MAKKRKTLPSGFYEIALRSDIDEIKAVFDKCQIDAYDDRFSLKTALHFPINAASMRYLVEQGLDVNLKDYYGRTPIFHHAMAQNSALNELIALGADVNARDRYGDTPLHFAASGFNAKNVQILLDNGANLRSKNDRDQTPMQKMLCFCQNIDIVNCVNIAKILLKAGEKASEDMKKSIAKIGENFEFHRANFAAEFLDETQAGLNELYALFDVSPAAKCEIYDGKSLIVLSGKNWQEKFDSAWGLLVSSKGAASTLQGEIIRVIGRIEHEILDNGAINWDKDFHVMKDELARYFTQGEFSEDLRQEAINLAHKISPNSDKDELYRIAELSVMWVEANLKPLPLDKPKYKR